MLRKMKRTVVSFFGENVTELKHSKAIRARCALLRKHSSGRGSSYVRGAGLSIEFLAAGGLGGTVLQKV